MKRLFLDAPHDHTRAQRTAQYEPLDVASDVAKTIVLTCAMFIGVTVIGTLLLVAFI